MHDRSALLVRLGTTVRELRKAREWSRRTLAERTGISERFLADIETGKANPSVLRLQDLADALATTPTALLGAPPFGARRRVIALLGLRGAGKSTVGAALAEALGWRFQELDALVEQTAGMTLNEVFQLHGEAYYRRLEGTVLRDLLEREDGLVLATGGGLVTAADTYDALRAASYTVWLSARPEDHWTRVVAQGDTRPMADNEQAFSDLCAILGEREKLYRQAELIVPTSGRTIGDLTAELRAHFAFLQQAEPS